MFVFVTLLVTLVPHDIPFTFSIFAHCYIFLPYSPSSIRGILKGRPRVVIESFSGGLTCERRPVVDTIPSRTLRS
jgi:hypothetical protein